jgi:YHS domain-containing protein
LKVDFINESSVSEPPELQTAPLYHIISLDEIQPGQEYYLIGVGKKMYFFASEEDLSEFKQHDKLYLQSNGSRMTHPVWRKPIHLSQLKKTSRCSYL